MMYRFYDFHHPGKPSVLAVAIACSLGSAPGLAQQAIPADLISAISQLSTEPCDPASIDQWPESFTVVVGSEGRDNIRVPNDNSHYVVYGLGGNDTIRGSKQSDVLCGGDDNDRIYGQQGGDYIRGGPGRDRLYGGRDDDALYGDEDNDRINGGSGSDFISAGPGDDYAYGSSGDDVIAGDDDDDRLYGNNGDDEISGGAGFDNAQGGGGIDQCTGAEVGSCELELGLDTDGDGRADDEDNCPTDPNPDQADNYGGYSGDACEDSDDDDIYDVNETDICISVAGSTILQAGTASCYSDPVPGLVAIANGEYAEANACNNFVINDYGKKKAAGKIANCSYDDEELSWASAGDVVAEALGMYTNAYASDGAGILDNGIPTGHARASGAYAYATATGTNNSAAAVGEDASAVVAGIGNSVSAMGQSSIAIAIGSGNTVSVTGNSSSATAYGSDSEANASGGDTMARAGDYSYYAEYTNDGTIEFYFDTIQSNNIARATIDDAQATAAGGEEGCTAIAPDEAGNLIVSCGEPEPET